MNINDFDGGFFVDGLRGTRKACHAQTVFQAACAADGAITGKTDFFLSMYQFPAAFVEQIKHTGRTAGYAGACRCEMLWFDIDREGDLPAAQADATRLTDFLVCGRTDDADTPGGEPANMLADDITRVFVPDSECVSLWFSGAKGFHVGLPMPVFGDAAAPSPAFASQCKAVAVEIARLAGIQIDTAVYDRVRLFRCPNTRHGKTGLYKIPLSYWELTAMRDVDAILKRAETPRRQVPSPAGNLDDVAFRSTRHEMPRAAEIWQTVTGCLHLADSAAQSEKKDTDKHNPPAKCQSQTLPDSGLSVPRLRRETLNFIWHGAQHGSRAVSLFQAAADCTRCAWPPDAIYSVLMDVARSTGLSGHEAEKQISAGVKAGGNGGALC